MVSGFHWKERARSKRRSREDFGLYQTCVKTFLHFKLSIDQIHHWHCQMGSLATKTAGKGDDCVAVNGRLMIVSIASLLILPKYTLDGQFVSLS